MADLTPREEVRGVAGQGAAHDGHDQHVPKSEVGALLQKVADPDTADTGKAASNEGGESSSKGKLAQTTEKIKGVADAALQKTTDVLSNVPVKIGEGIGAAFHSVGVDPGKIKDQGKEHMGAVGASERLYESDGDRARAQQEAEAAGTAGAASV